jgi:hypothetical protein
MINRVVSLWKTDSMDQGNLIYIYDSLEDHGHNSEVLIALRLESGSVINWRKVHLAQCSSHPDANLLYVHVPTTEMGVSKTGQDKTSLPMAWTQRRTGPKKDQSALLVGAL